MKKYLDLLHEVQHETGLPLKDVKAIMQATVQSLAKAIAEEDRVQIPGFGTFKVVVKRGHWNPKLKRAVNKQIVGDQLVPHDRQYMVTFTKGALLRNMLHLARGKPSEDTMNKYAVDEEVDQEDLEKKANTGCPECGRKVERHGKTLMCPVHGTEPFESK